MHVVQGGGLGEEGEKGGLIECWLIRGRDVENLKTWRVRILYVLNQACCEPRRRPTKVEGAKLR